MTCPICLKEIVADEDAPPYGLCDDCRRRQRRERKGSTDDG
jgi:hypothetical protein